MKMIKGPEMRYGKALFALSVDPAGKSVSKDVATLRNFFTENVEVQNVLSDEIVSREDKKNVLLATLKLLKTSKTLNDFAALMCDKGRGGLFKDALSWYHFYEMAKNGVVTASVRTAKKLTVTQRKNIEKFVKDNAKDAKTIELEEEVDASLVAGFRIRIGSIEHDMSVRGRLDGLRTSLN